MSDPGPWFYAWSGEAERVDAFTAALSALADPKYRKELTIHSVLRPGEMWRRDISVEEIITLARANFDSGTQVFAVCGVELPSGGRTAFYFDCYGDAFTQRYPTCGPLEGRGDEDDIYGKRLDVVFPPGGRSIVAEAAIHTILVQTDTEDVLLRLCTPEESKRVTTGALSAGDWHAPVELSGTYHAFAREIARDIALSWIHLYDGDVVNCTAGLSLEALAARVDAAPRGSRVGVAPDVKRRNHHLGLDAEARNVRDQRPPRPDLARKGPRAILPTDAELTREQVLAVLETAPTTLIEALEAAALPDDEWRNIEPLALELIDAHKAGAPTLEVQTNTGHHIRFIEQHAPYHVRRLPNGGILLATHPYRTLWKLWADALVLLGIRA